MASREFQAQPFIAFGTPDFTSEEVEAIVRVMRSGWVGMGAETIAFERELAEYLGAAEVVSVNSCTSALFLALLVEGVGEGDEVVVPSLTWCASANAALYLRAQPVLCDVDPETLCATTETILARVTPRTRAVVVVHYGGLAVDVAALREALPPRVAIVEDAAHAMGSRYPDGRRVGDSGNLVCFSFYANKNLSTGEGGAIALADGPKAARLRSLRMNGLESNAWSRYVDPKTSFVPEIEELGYKMNFTDLQAAIGRVQLRRLEEMGAKRARLAERYRRRLGERGMCVPFQRQAFDSCHSRHLLVGFFDPTETGRARDALVLELRARAVGASVHYRPLHVQPLYRPYAKAALAATDLVAGHIMTLPISARMAESDVDYVIDQLELVMRREGRP